MPLVDFISSNPAIDEFNRANKVADDRTTQDLANKTAAFKLQTDQAEAPLKLKQLTADTAFAGTRAETAAAAAPYAGPKAAAELASTRASTQAAIAGMNNAEARILMDANKQEMERLDAGDPEGAKRIAASVKTRTFPNGYTIPDEIIQNSQTRLAYKNIVAAAMQYHPNQPRNQMGFITSHIHELHDQQQRGQQVNPQTAPYSQAPGAPEIPETNARAMTWGRIGSDEYGQPTYGWIDKGNQTIAPAPPAPPGVTWAPDSPGGPPAPPAPPGVTRAPDSPGGPPAPYAAPPASGTPAQQRPGAALPSAPGQASASATGAPGTGNVTTDMPPMGNATPGPQDVHGEDYLRTLPPNDRELVKGIAENRINPNSLSIRGGHRERILGMVAQYKPEFNQTMFSGAQSYQRTAGSAGARVEMASNEVAQALPLAIDASRNLPRGSFVPWNTLVQKYQQGTSDPAYNDFIVKNFALVNAYTRAMNPLGVPRIQERLEQHANGILSAATSPEAYEVQTRALWQEVERSRRAIAETRGGVGPSANEATTDQPMPGPSGGNLPHVNSVDEARSLGSGAHFIDPNGIERIVP